MLCVDLKNSFYQLPNVHRGLYDVEGDNTNDENLDSSSNIQVIKEEQIPCNEFLSDLTKEDQFMGKLLFYIMNYNCNMVI